MIIGKVNLEKKLLALADEKVAKKGLEYACIIVEASAKAHCPADEGELRNSIAWKVDGLIGEVGTNLYYAPYVHQGTGIYARNGLGRQEPWAWPATEAQVEKYGVPMPIPAPSIDGGGNYYNVSYDKNGQAWIWTRGQEPHPFLEQALDENKDNINKAFMKAIKEAVND